MKLARETTSASPEAVCSRNDLCYCARALSIYHVTSAVECLPSPTSLFLPLPQFTYVFRAVANGPVGPAMAGPIIEPAIFFFLNFLLDFLAGIIIDPGFFSILFLKQRRQSRQNIRDYHGGSTLCSSD